MRSCEHLRGGLNKLAETLEVFILALPPPPWSKDLIVVFPDSFTNTGGEIRPKSPGWFRQSADVRNLLQNAQSIF